MPRLRRGWFNCVDLPPEHDSELCDLTIDIDLDFIRLATPTTDKKRLNIVLNKSSGFLYYVSIMGITGTKEPNLDILKEQVIKLKKKPIFLLVSDLVLKDQTRLKRYLNFLMQ